MEDYGLSDRQSTEASDRAVDSRVVLVRKPRVATHNGKFDDLVHTGSDSLAP
jgi:hypothetical protein